MDKRSASDQPLELRNALLELTHRTGVQREDLLELLKGKLSKLQECWMVNLNNGPHIAQQIIALNLHAHIERLKVRADRQKLGIEKRREQYVNAIKVCFNTLKIPELEGKDLTQRQTWLAEDARGLLKIDESTCRRDLRDALDQIEQQILASGYKPVQEEPPPLNLPETPHRQPLSLTINLQQQATIQELDTAVVELANAVKHRLRAERRLRRPPEPPYLIPLRWNTARDEDEYRYADHWENIHGIPGKNEPLILDGTLGNIADTYNKVPSGRLVILGYPGGGKTTVVTELALALLEKDTLPYDRVPVIFNLSSWKPNIESLRDWMIGFLIAGYSHLFADAQKQEIARRLVYWDRILPILDGFDEIAAENRTYGLRVLNTSFDRTDRFVLTSRPGEYLDALEREGPLPAAAAIGIEDLTTDDVIAYLPSPKWDSVIEHFRGEDETKLEYWQAKATVEILSNPLMLSVARTVYGDRYANPNELLDFARFHKDTATADYLFDRYIEATYEQPPQDRDSNPVKPYVCSPWQAQVWLGCIAAYLCGMYSLDLPAWDMQRPMTKLREVLSYSFLGRQGAAAKIMPTWAEWRTSYGISSRQKRRGLRRYISRSAGYAVFMTWFALEIAWRVTRHDVGPSNLRAAAIALPVIGLAFFAVQWFFIRSLAWKIRSYENPMLPARSSRLASFLIAATELFAWESTALLASWAVSGKFVFYPPLELWPIPGFVLLFLIENAVSTYWTNDIHQFWLTVTGKLPRHKLEFLEDAYRRGLLRKNGGMYQFRHRIFQERLAKQWISAQPQRVAKSLIMLRAVKALETPYRYLRP